MDHLKTTIDSIRNLRKRVHFNEQFLPAVREHKRRNDIQFSNLLEQLWGTERVLCHLSSSTLEAHLPFLQELDCVLGRAITLVKEVSFKSKDSTSRREHDTGEHYLQVFLDLRWWTWVLIYNTPLRTACDGESFFVTPKGVLDPSFSRLPSFMQKLYLWWKSSDGYARHLPSYGIEVFLQETEGLSSLLVWLKTESEEPLDKFDITRNICSTSAEVFNIEGKVLVPALYPRKPSWVGDELKVDLTQVLLGMSSSGLVIKCKDSGTEYALKRVQNLNQGQPVTARLCHPHIVQLMSYWRENDFLFLMMEFMEGDFEDLIRRRLRVKKAPFILNVVLDILLQIAKAMLYLHDMGLTHPHLKSSDVLFKEAAERSKLDNNDTKYLVKLGDFQFYSKNDFESMAQQNVYQFGLICLEVLSTEPLRWELEERVMGMSEEPKLQFNKIQNRHGYAIPGSLTQCISRCLDGSIKFSEVVVMLLLAQLQVLMRATKETSPRSLDSEHALLAKHQGILSSPGSSSRFTMNTEVDESIAPSKEIPVDFDHQLSKVKGLLKMNYIGIVGVGGIGKTTLAKAIFDDVTLNSSYHASCFVAQCKDYQSSYDILRKILPKLGNDQKSKNFGDAQGMMKELLVEKKVLLILDDIKDDSQVRDIVPPDIVQASKGTTIILTTRDWSTIQSLVGIKGRLNMELLDEKAATMLFTTHLSWGVTTLSPDFEDLCKHVVKACNGLPLSLKVMGAFLHHKEKLQSWEQALQRMARGRTLDGNEGIWNTLKISFDGLTDVEKRMFLDVACLFCRDVYPFGISKETILYMWSKDGILPVGELKRLIGMSLLEVNEDGDILEMHDQLRDMGRMIAKDTRIWKASMIPEIHFSSKDAEVLEGISCRGDINHVLPLEKRNQSFDFEKLRILILVSSLGNYKAHFDALDLLLRVGLQCSKLEAVILEDFQNGIALPHIFSTNTTTTLNRRISDLCGTCKSLKILDLRELGFLKLLPNKFASCNTLLRLDLSLCTALVALSKEIGNLTSLTTLNLEKCSSLVALPKEVGNMSSLTTLNLSCCSSLLALPKEVGNLSSLTTLNLSSCFRLLTLPKEVGNLSSLTTLNLGWCSNLVVLPKEVGNLSSLTTLNLKECSSLATLPREVGNLSSLTTLNLSSFSSLLALPKEVGNLSFLTILELSWCSSLVALPKEVGNLSSLTILELSWCSSLLALPKEVGNLSSLATLNLRSCSSLVALPKEVGNLSSLTTLNLSWCSSLLALSMEVGSLSSLTNLNLEECSSLATLPTEVGNLSSLTTLNLSSCSSLLALPKEVGNLSSLTTLNLRSCSSMVALPKEVWSLSSLTTLKLGWYSSLVALPKEVGNLSFLTTLNLRSCSSLVALPKEVGSLSSLTTLNLRKCSSLVALPKEVGDLSSLTILELSWCSSLVALPKEVWNLSSLTNLNLEECSSLTTLPTEVGNLSSLTTLNLGWCSRLLTLPKEVGNLSSLTTLNLRSCSSLVALPKEVGNLSSLTTLNLKKCSKLAALPMEVGNLSSLTTLNLSSCSSLLALPKEVGNLSSLTTLNLRSCSSLVALPKEVGNLSSLTILNLEECSSLATLPTEVRNLSSLTIPELSCVEAW